MLEDTECSRHSPQINLKMRGNTMTQDVYSTS
jgi:hypothetical protein